MQEQDYNPLVSIIVITYNSAQFVIETLESAKSQTYENIELIVSDDASSDNTVEICREWIEQNKQRFVRTELITVEKNTGIPANCNRGVRASQGEWVKIIAGDDMLYNDSIDIYVDTVKQTSEEHLIITSNMKVYDKIFNNNSLMYVTSKADDLFNNRNISAENQLKLLVRGYGPLAPTLFVNRNIYQKVGAYNESLPYEDGPFWVNVTSASYKINFIDKALVKYRYHTSASNVDLKKFLFKPIFEKDYLVFKTVYRHHLNYIEKICIKYIYSVKWLLSYFHLNRRNYFLIFFYNLLISPAKYIQLFFLKINIQTIRKQILKNKI